MTRREWVCEWARPMWTIYPSPVWLPSMSFDDAPRVQIRPVTCVVVPGSLTLQASVSLSSVTEGL